MPASLGPHPLISSEIQLFAPAKHKLKLYIVYPRTGVAFIRLLERLINRSNDIRLIWQSSANNNILVYTNILRTLKINYKKLMFA